jgi:hypothetical protein
MALTWIQFVECESSINPVTLGIVFASGCFLAYLFERFYR